MHKDISLEIFLLEKIINFLIYFYILYKSDIKIVIK